MVSTRRRQQHCPPRRQLQSPVRVLLLALRPSCCFEVFCLHGLDFWNWQHPFAIMALRCQGQMEKGTKPFFHFQNKLVLSHRGLASWATWHSLPWSHLCCLPARAIRSFESSLQAPDPHLPVWAGRTSPFSLRGWGPQDKSGPISFSCSPAENQAVSFTSPLLPALHLRNEHLLSRGASTGADGLNPSSSCGPVPALWPTALSCRFSILLLGFPPSTQERKGRLAVRREKQALSHSPRGFT